MVTLCTHPAVKLYGDSLHTPSSTIVWWLSAHTQRYNCMVTRCTHPAVQLYG